MGNEPPLTADGRNGVLVDKRRVSTRWYSGTILTGLCGAALMGGAVYASLDGEAYFAASPERAEPLRGSLVSAERNSTRKTDKLALAAETHSARQIIRISTTTKVGDREAVRLRPYVRISTTLATSTSELSANIPAFNQARIQSSAADNSTATPDEAPNVDDAEITFAVRDLGPALVRAKIAGTLAPEDMLAHIRNAAEWTAGPSTPPIVADGQARQALAYATDGAPDPYAGVETRIVPENITLLPKTAVQTTGGNDWNERTVTAKKGDTIVSVLRDLGATQDEAKAIADIAGKKQLKEGQKLKVLLSSIGDRKQPIRVICSGDQTTPETVVALSDTGQYVSVDVQSAETTQVTEADEDDDETGGSVRLYASLYETALRQGVPRSMIDEIARIYSYDVDFQRRVQPGDSIEILYPSDEEGGADKSEILYTSLTIGGETKRYYRFQTPDDGTVDYYDETGKSAKKFLVRKPITAGIMRSGYGWRRHPILGYSKMHTGVDWAAPRGTPIYAAGTGVVEKAEWEGGYGRYIRVRHAYGYETAYGHMSAFARGIHAGSKVRQGQLIGYVGSTGLSTGAHVHYEILVNGRFVDPNRIKLPRGRSLEGPVFASFERERDKFDAIMNRSPGRVAAATNARAGGAAKSTKRMEAAVFSR